MLVSAGNKCVEDLQMYKRDKQFLDLLAISDGLKSVQLKSSTHRKPAQKDTTFMTSVKTAQQPIPKTVTEPPEHLQALVSKLTDGTMDLQDIDLQTADYSDDDEQIYFDKRSLIN